MPPKSKLKPLTQEEQKFAKQNHRIVYWYLNSCGLSVDDWYDIVIFGYLSSVQKYLKNTKLQKYAFSTIAKKAMQSSIGNELAARKSRIQPLSLDAVLSEDENFTGNSALIYDVSRFSGCYGEGIIEKEIEGPDRHAIQEFLSGKIRELCFVCPQDIRMKMYKKIWLYMKNNYYTDICKVSLRGNNICLIWKEIKNEHKNRPIRDRER